VGRHLVYLSLGSNLGDRKRHLAHAVACLHGLLGELKLSSLYETAPQELIDQPFFLNIAVSGRTELEPKALLEAIMAIESRLGRDRRAAVPKGPRVIDIDLLLFGERIIAEESLQVPHPRMTGRRFVLQPLLELDPTLRHPATGEPLSRCLERLGEQGVYNLGPWDYTLPVPEHDCGRPGRETKI
jgi:2-amino-4-hydroxy-6-hydroxymethyldihydropteridine diphosphokinase